jgi:DNA invertase Pin-like site-specific DNA recombinase
MSKKITAVYVRVSSVQQKIDSQVDELNKWIEVHQPGRVRWYRASAKSEPNQILGFE